ncbi:response regulator transcription factor [Azospirillum sp.]|uniref:response regulator transcription factor n=1 Tax=Azospirillum sp. TaxID=34012 RepID=UPI003D74280C
MRSEVTIHVVDDDADFRASLVRLLAVLGYTAREYGDGRAFADVAPGLSDGCALVDVCMPDLDGLTLQQELAERGAGIPIIIVTGHGDVPMAVRAMKAGAADFLQKPFTPADLRASIESSLQRWPAATLTNADPEVIAFMTHLETLTGREREVLEGIVAGHPTKIIAYRLGISTRTIDVHRASITEKLRVRGLPNLVRLALAAGVRGAPYGG